MLLTLDERDQSVVHRLLMARPEAGLLPLSPDVLDALARLVPCDVVELAELDRDGHLVRSLARLPRGRRLPGPGDGLAQLVCPTPMGMLVTVSLRRSGRPFSDRDRAVLRMVEPVIAALIRARAGSSGDGLSDSERRVLSLVASGASNAEVAGRLSVSVATVRKHLEHSYRKLGVTNRTAAVAAIRELRPPAAPEQRKGSRIG